IQFDLAHRHPFASSDINSSRTWRLAIGSALGCSLIFSENGVQHSLQLQWSEWFRKKDGDACVETFFHQLEIVFGSNHDDWNPHQPLFRSHLANDIQPLKVRHHHVENRGLKIRVSLKDAKRLK